MYVQKPNQLNYYRGYIYNWLKGLSDKEREEKFKESHQMKLLWLEGLEADRYNSMIKIESVKSR